jgi:hypothetical protein
MKTTKAGFVNPNGQKNLGRVGKSSSHWNQYLYKMKCQHDGHEYQANGCDIFERKCPRHQNGHPSSV